MIGTQGVIEYSVDGGVSWRYGRTLPAEAMSDQDALARHAAAVRRFVVAMAGRPIPIRTRVVWADRAQVRVIPGTANSRLRTVFALIRRDGDCCWYCRTVLPPEAYTLDHVHPRALGGSNELSNLRLACPECNVRKGDHVLVEVPSVTRRHKCWPDPKGTCRICGHQRGRRPIPPMVHRPEPSEPLLSLVYQLAAERDSQLTAEEQRARVEALDATG